MFIMAANCAGIVGGQLFRSDDLPHYTRGWTIIAALMSLALALVISLLIMYKVANTRLKNSGELKEESGQCPSSLESGDIKTGVAGAAPKICNY